jgi:hypothetical protein
MIDEMQITRNALGQAATEKKSQMNQDSSQMLREKRSSQVSLNSREGSSRISLGVSKINRDRDEMYQDQQAELGYNELLQTAPENWKNIAMPVIMAVKNLIRTSDKTHHKLFETQMLLDETGQRLAANTNRLNKELQTNSNRFDAAIRLVE